MSIYNNLRDQARLDSRRFGKGIVCRIVYGQLLSVCQRHGMVPPGIIIDNDYGLDRMSGKMLVIPVYIYPKIQALLKSYTPSALDNPNVKEDLDQTEKITQAESGLVSALKQNIVLVTITIDIPEGKKAGLDPETFDVIIDSIDVNQTIEARYVYRNKANIRTIPRLDD